MPDDPFRHPIQLGDSGKTNNGDHCSINHYDPHNSNNEVINTNVAYGINAQQTLFMDLSYRLNASNNQNVDPLGDLSFLFRQNIWQKDNFSGTNHFLQVAPVSCLTEQEDLFLVGGEYLGWHW